MEEAGDLSRAQLLTRAEQFERIDDLARVHGLPGYWMDMRKVVPAWSGMARLVLRLQSHPGWQDREIVRDYQATRLGRLDGDTFLAEILPPTRLRYLGELFDEHRPAYVFGYGKSYWPYYMKIVGVTEREDLEPGKIALGVSVGRGSCSLTSFRVTS